VRVGGADDTEETGDLGDDVLEEEGSVRSKDQAVPWVDGWLRMGMVFSELVLLRETGSAVMSGISEEEDEGPRGGRKVCSGQGKWERNEPGKHGGDSGRMEGWPEAGDFFLIVLSPVLFIIGMIQDNPKFFIDI
jgi:hypothetical protein